MRRTLKGLPLFASLVPSRCPRGRCRARRRRRRSPSTRPCRARLGDAGAPPPRRERARLPRVPREVLRRPRLRPVRPALGRQRRARRCVRELQPLAGAARARRQTTRSSGATSRRWKGMIRQYSEAKTTRRPGRARRHVREGVLARSRTGCTTARACSSSTACRCRCPTLPAYRERARRFAGFYMGEDPEAPNYDPEQEADPLDDQRQPRPAAAQGHAARLGRRSVRRDRVRRAARRAHVSQFLEHYKEYTDVVGDHFLNLVATTLPTERLSRDRRGEVSSGGSSTTWTRGWRGCRRTAASSRASSISTAASAAPTGRWWGNAYGWGFSPVNPVTGQREDRNRIPRALVGFSNALLVTGDRKYVDAWRAMIDAVNANARVDERTQGIPDDARRRRLVWVAAGAVERRRARGLVLVDARRRSRARRRRSVAGVPRTARSRLSGSGAAARSGEHPAPAGSDARRPRRRPTSGSPTTCSTTIPRPPTRSSG